MSRCQGASHLRCQGASILGGCFASSPLRCQDASPLRLFLILCSKTIINQSFQGAGVFSILH
eukprot:12092418-Prorocentrum_lima.AAC.1